MSAERASFYTRDPDLFVLGVAETQTGKYEGVDRRMENRRQGKDRRVDVRFNLTSQDRRENVGRRAEDVLPKFW
tara:strand:- start:55 stop:276 length:222 start_codon:yes stop_codon:yes gene_type:complete